MKYANLDYRWRNDEINIGDDIQLLAIDYLYTLMGIPAEEIVRIPFYELCTYDDEDVILPICFPFHNFIKDDFYTQFSIKITPVFLHLSIGGIKLSSKDIEYYKKYEPIGCRDLNTLRVLRREGITAYASGCITQIFPVRKNESASQNVFLVDADKSLLDHIPIGFKQDAKVRTHALRYSEIEKTSREIAIDQLKEYAADAKFIITSRLHCALPAVAMGIPTIFAASKRSHRFEGIDRMIPFYSAEEYLNINWHPAAVDDNLIKNKMIDLDIRRLRQEHVDEAELQQINKIFDTESTYQYHMDYVTESVTFINTLMKKQHDTIRYYLWGITPTALTLYWHIKTNYPKSSLLGVIDKNKKIEFCGTVSGGKNEVIKQKDAWVFVCTRNALYESKDFFEHHGMKHYFQCCGDQYTY